MTEQLADQLKRLGCAETEGKFFDCVTDNIDTIIAALRATQPATSTGGESEKQASDAPVWYSAEAASGWADGYNTALATAMAQSSEQKPFYGAQCPSYPDCSGGYGSGCTHEIEQSLGRSFAGSDSLVAMIDAIIADNIYVDNDGVAGVSSAAEAIVAALPRSSDAAQPKQVWPKEIRSLVNEIAGVWDAFEIGIRQEISNTNYTCVREKLTAVESLLAPPISSTEGK